MSVCACLCLFVSVCFSVCECQLPGSAGQLLNELEGLGGISVYLCLLRLFLCMSVSLSVSAREREREKERKRKRDGER